MSNSKCFDKIKVVISLHRKHSLILNVVNDDGSTITRYYYSKRRVLIRYKYTFFIEKNTTTV